MSIKKFPKLSDDKYVKRMEFFTYEEAKQKIREIVLNNAKEVQVLFIQDVEKWRVDMKKALEERLEKYHQFLTRNHSAAEGWEVIGRIHEAEELLEALK